jgi:hypothetical protein
MPVDFVLETFNYELEMGVSGEMFEIPIPVLDTSANAEYYASVSSMRNAFYFQTDSRDISDLSGDDIKYYVNWPVHVILNPCHAYVSSNAIATTDLSGNIPSNRQLVKHDFIRHIAKDLFNTHLAVDLFQNEQALKDDLASKGHSEAWESILSDISAVSITNTTLQGPDGSGEYYITNGITTNNNLTRELLGQVISSAPVRLYDLSGIALNNNLALEKFSIPFQDGDSISFKLTLKAAPNQHLLVDKVNPVPDRTYRIRLNIVDTVNGDSSTYEAGSNVIVDDCVSNSSLNNSRVISTIPNGYKAVAAPAVNTTSTTSVSNLSLNGASMFVPGSTTAAVVALTQSSTPPAESTFVSIPAVETYLKLEPVGAVFTSHISFEIAVTPGTALSLFFKRSTDPEPVLIPQTNTSANDVYYTYVQATGIITLYTKHFSEVFVTEPAPTPVDLTLSTITLSGAGSTYSIANGTTVNTTKTVVNSTAALSYIPLSNFGKIYGPNSFMDAVNSIAKDSNGNIYYAGSFSSIDGVIARNIVKWNPNTNTWSPLGGGLGSACFAIYISNDILYATGQFSSANGDLISTPHIARYNIATDTWSGFGGGVGMNNWGFSLGGDSQGNIYFGGEFTTLTNKFSEINKIIKYNPSTDTWSKLGTGLGGGRPNAICCVGTDVYVAGEFTSAGGQTVNRIAKWNGTAWSTVGAGLNGNVYSLTYDSTNNVLYAGGSFSNLANNTLPLTNIGKYDLNTSTWSAINRTSSYTYSIFYDNDKLYIGDGSNFVKFTISTSTSEFLARNVGLRSLCLSGTTLYFGGTHTYMRDSTNTIIHMAKDIGKVDINTHALSYVNPNIDTTSTIFPGINAGANTMLKFKNDLYFISGNISGISNSVTPTYFAKLDLSTHVMSGISNPNITYWIDSDNALATDNDYLYVRTNDSPICRYDGSGVTVISNTIAGNAYGITVTNNGLLYYFNDHWSQGKAVYRLDRPALTSTQIGTAFNQRCYLLKADNNNVLYVSGAFSSPTGYIVKYVNSAWTSLGSGLNNVCISFDFDTNNNLYVGGTFTTAGGISANRIAMWDGSTWSALGQGLNNSCSAIKVYKNLVYAAGQFTTANNVACSKLAIWNPVSKVWYSVNLAGSTNFNIAGVKSIAFDDSHIYLSGNFVFGYGDAVYRNILKLPQPNIATLSGNFIKSGVTANNLILNAQETRTLTWNGSQWSIS